MKLKKLYKNSLYLSLLFLVGLGYSVKSQTTATVTIGNQSTNYISYYTPFNNYYNYSWSDNVYLTTDIGQAGTITQIAFYVYEGDNLNISGQSIYMRETSATSFTSSTYPGTTGFTQVYSGNINYVYSNYASGWQVITLTTPFVYDGLNSLEVLTLNNSGSYSNNYQYFYVTEGYSNNRCKLDYNTNSFPSSCVNCGAYSMLTNCQLMLNLSCTPATTVTPTSATVCAGTGTSITASGASTYTWSPATGLNTTTGASVTATPTANITYSVASTNSASCVSTHTVSITVNTLPSLTVTPSSATICAGNSTTLTAGGGTSYTWAPTTGLSSSTATTVTANPTVTTTYTLTGKNSNNCTSTQLVTITVNPVTTITVSPSSASICTGNNTTLVAGGAQSYVWSPSTGLNTTTSASVTASPTTSITYTVTGNCNNTQTVVVTVNTLPSLTVTPSSASICTGSSTTLTASGASTYTWTPTSGLNASTGSVVTASPSATTTYTVTGTNSNNCTNTKTVVVTVNPLPTLTVTPNTATVCAGTSTTLTASGANTYTWSPTTGLSSSTGSVVTATPTTTTTYTIIGMNANGCVNSQTALINVNPDNAITISPSSPAICIGGSTALTASGATSYTWSPSTGLNTTTSASVTASPTTTTTYTVTGNCNQKTNVTLTVNALPTLTVSPASAAMCLGASTTLTVSGASTYTWSPTTGLSSSNASITTASPSATTTYTVTGTNSNNCTNTQTAVVTINALPSISISPNNSSICVGTSTTLTASGASTYTWSPSTGLNASTGSVVTANPTVTTTYTISGTNSNGCIGTNTAVVNINSLPTLTVTPNNPAICNAASTTLTASGGSTYTWSPATGLNSTSGSSVIANPTSNTVYTVSGTGSDGCLAYATATVSLSYVNAGSAVATATGATTTCNNNQVSLSVSNANIEQVGTGTNSSNNYPFNGYYNYSWSDVIYLQSDLGAAGTLTSLSFYVNNSPSNYVMNNQDIFIRNTTASSFTGTAYPGSSNFTQVFSGTITYNGTGWATITLNTPYSYNGTSNLEILYENHNGAWANGFPTFNYTSGYSANRVMRDYEDATFPSTCDNCAAYSYVPNTEFNFTRTLGTFVNWQSSTDNIHYNNISGGTTESFNTTVNTSTYFRAQMTNGSCTAPSASAYYRTNNNYYVNDNATTGDVFCTAIGNSSNDGRDPSRPQTTVNYILTTYTLGPCDTIFVDAGSYNQEVDIYYPQGGNNINYSTIHGAGVNKTTFTAPSGGYNFYMYQPDYWKIENIGMSSSQSYANVLLYEAGDNIIANNHMSHSAYSNVQIFGDAINCNNIKILNNNITNSSTNGNAIDVEGNADSTLVQEDTVSMTNSSSEDALIFYGYQANSHSTIYYPAQNVISNNVINAYSYGISLYGNVYPISTFTINNNNITMNIQTVSDGAPIWLGGVGSSSVDITYIYDNRLIGGNNGIYFYQSADYLNIYNNYISNNNYGVYVSNANNDINSLYFNSFYNSNTNLYFVSGSNAYWKVKNNILYTTATTTAGANIFVGNNTTFADCNYNLFYAPSGASTARFNSTNYASLSAWQAVTHATATTHGDESSATGNPVYTSPSTNVLDISGTSPEAYKGVTISGIPTDIYGLTRTSTPSMGADEPSEAGSSFYFRSIASGNWNSLSTWQASPDSVNWIAADIIPTYLQKSINIQTGNVVTITSSVTIDQVTVNGTLIYGNNAGSTLSINDGLRTDLTINGTFQYNSPDSIIWVTNSTYALGASGTLQISSNNIGNGWRLNYAGGISTIPATANWILNNTGVAPTLYSNAGMYYPNLTIQNNSGSAWTTGIFSSFTGSSTPPTIKGNFDIGGTGANPVVFVYQNTDATPILVQGNLTVETGSTFQNNGTGFNVQGNLTFNGSFTGTKNLFFSGSNAQSLTGSALSTLNNLTLNKPSGNLTLNTPVAISGILMLTSGNIISSATNLLTINNGATVSGGSMSSFVAGPVQKIGNSAFTFPTGKGTDYQPIGISAPATATDAFTAEYINMGQTFGTATDSTIDSLSTCEYWNLSETVGSDSVSVTAGWNSNSCKADSSNLMALANWNGSKWVNAGITSVSGNRQIGSIITPHIIPNHIIIGHINFCLLFYNLIAHAGPPRTMSTGGNVNIGLNPIATGSSLTASSVNYSWNPVTTPVSGSELNGIVNVSGITTTTTYTLTVTYLGCIATATTTVYVTNQQQAIILKRELDGGFYDLTAARNPNDNGLLVFKYNEEYNSNGSTGGNNLNYYIYDMTQTVKASGSAPILSPVAYKDNRFSLPLTSLSLTPPNSFYILEVIDRKGEKFYLRFKY